MGRIKKRGSIGSISGTVNDVVISEWNDIAVVRSLPKPIDYSKILVASGTRFNTERAAAKPVGDTILFKWERDLIPTNYATDKAILVAYCEALNKCIYTAMGPPRSACKAKLEVAVFRGQAVHTWLSFITTDGQLVADSIYTGKLIMGS